MRYDAAVSRYSELVHLGSSRPHDSDWNRMHLHIHRKDLECLLTVNLRGKPPKGRYGKIE